MEKWVWYKCPMESSKESPTLEWYQWEVLKLDHSNVFSFCLVMFVGHWRQIIWLDDRRKHVEINICLLWECLKTPLKQNGTSMSAKNWRHSTICNWKYHRFRDPPSFMNDPTNSCLSGVDINYRTVDPHPKPPWYRKLLPLASQLTWNAAASPEANSVKLRRGKKQRSSSQLRYLNRGIYIYNIIKGNYCHIFI